MLSTHASVIAVVLSGDPTIETPPTGCWGNSGAESSIISEYGR